jgi:predicted transcriptional regulator
MAESKQPSYVDLAAQIVSAYVGKNPVPAADLPRLIGDVHAALTRVGNAGNRADPGRPAVPVKRSITPEYIVCLEGGRKFKSLRRHLRSQYNLTPEQYRARWGLPLDYPTVAPNYAATRSALAKQMGLGHARRRRK